MRGKECRSVRRPSSLSACDFGSSPSKAAAGVPRAGDILAAMTSAVTTQRVGADSRGRAFYSIRVPSLSLVAWPANLALASPYFVCLVVADGTTETTEELGQWAKLAVEQGLVYMCAWGPSCEVVEDIVDWAFVALPDHPDRPIVMTTSHSGESVEAAVDFFVGTAKPADGYLSRCSSWLLVEAGAAGARSGAQGHLVQRVSS